MFMSLTDFFEKFEDSCEPNETATFSWSAKGHGFGQVYFYVDKKDGYVHCNNEIMSREFIKEMLCIMVDNCVLDCPGRVDEENGTHLPPGYTPKPMP